MSAEFKAAEWEFDPSIELPLDSQLVVQGYTLVYRYSLQTMMSVSQDISWKYPSTGIQNSL